MNAKNSPEKELDYLRRVEALAREVLLEAVEEGRPMGAEATPFDRALTQLARVVRGMEHFESDGCLADDPPLLPLAGIVVLKPQAMPPTAKYTYESACGGLGVRPREEGWAVWNVWDREAAHRYALVLSDFTATMAVLRNWRTGHAVHPGEPFRHHIAQRVDGWLRPMITFPHLAERAGLGGRR